MPIQLITAVEESTRATLWELLNSAMLNPSRTVVGFGDTRWI